MMLKRYTKELIILAIQLVMFYLFPLCAGPTDVIGMVLLMLLTTFLLSVVLGVFSKEPLKYAYPLAIAVLFIPTIFIHYNESASIHAVWYLVVSAIGLLFGVILRKLFHRE